MAREQAPSILALLLTILPAGYAHAAEPIPWIDDVAVGLLAHDRGPTSDEHEHGIDPNLELLFHPPTWHFWEWIGAPRPHLGLTPNFNGDTSTLYAGGTYTFDLSSRLFADGALGLALHNGPLHAADRVACEQDSDCGFGSRVLFRYAVEVGLKIANNSAISLFYDHTSHQGALADENEGIDHIGLRYRFAIE